MTALKGCLRKLLLVSIGEFRIGPVGSRGTQQKKEKYPPYANKDRKTQAGKFLPCDRGITVNVPAK